jgi:WbqC-like protein family
MKSCAIVQSNYIPWKGYFDMINMVDEFVLFDCVQYTRRDWRNRNRIKTARGAFWLTIPVQSKGNYEAPIDTILVSDPHWAEQHWQTIAHSYAKAPCFDQMSGTFQKCYEELAHIPSLSQINRLLIEQVCQLLNIKTKLSDSRLFEIQDGRNERLLHLCKQVGADVYYSGPAAKDYMDEALMKGQGVEVRWMTYDNYPEYTQLFPPFEHGVSILDLLFNVGQEAPNYMNSFTRLSPAARG